jgi:glycosyltransferase involved in cell wall biosynthesis
VTQSVSVVVPVYNAARFVTEAVESALAQPETAEVILVEDASPDNSLEVCRALVEKYDKVHLYQHPGGANRGAGPSRNLGMEKSTSEFIAFLDADDFHLPGRFTKASSIFSTNPDCDAVYEVVGIHFEDERGRQRWLASNMAAVQMTTMTRRVPPEDLFAVLTKGGSGHIHLDGLVIRRSVLQKSGYMNDEIADTLHEDTDFILKLAAVGKLLPGSIDKPVAMRRAHAENRVSAPRPAASVYRDKMRLRVANYRWCRKAGLREHQRLSFERMLDTCEHEKPLSRAALRKAGLSAQATLRLLAWPADCADVLWEGQYWHELGSSAWGIIRNDLLRLKG